MLADKHEPACKLFKMADDEKEKVYSWDFRKFIKSTPCAREALMYGIIGGLGIGGVSFLKTKHVRRSCDVTVGSFAIGSLSVWELCRYLRHKEKERIKRTVDMLNEYSERKREENKDEPAQT